MIMRLHHWLEPDDIRIRAVGPIQRETLPTKDFSYQKLEPDTSN